MDTKQLVETSRQLSKAHEGGDPPSTLISLLSPLEKFKATEELLRQSKIGIVVAKLRSSKDPKVASLAGQLIIKWKADVKKKGTPTGKSLGVNGVENGRSATSSPAPKREAVAAPPPAAKKFSVAPDKRTAKADGVDTAVTNNTIRDGSIQLIYNGLAFLSEESPEDIMIVTRRVEDAAYEAYKPDTSTEASNTYRAQMRSLYLNLKMRQNSELRSDVFNGSIPPEKFVQMTSEELKSKEAKEKDKSIEKENMNKAMAAQEEKAISTTYVPRREPKENMTTQSRTAGQYKDLTLPHPLTSRCPCRSLRGRRIGCVRSFLRP